MSEKVRFQKLGGKRWRVEIGEKTFFIEKKLQEVTLEDRKGRHFASFFGDQAWVMARLVLERCFV